MNRKIVQEKDTGHIDLTCVNHPELLWSTKNIGSRNEEGVISFDRSIFYFGLRETRRTFDANDQYIEECNCSFRDLRVIEDEA